jgi:hypothetical protein
VATKQSSVFLFEGGFARSCWIATSLTLLAMTKPQSTLYDRHVAALFAMTKKQPSASLYLVIASGNETIQRLPF